MSDVRDTDCCVGRVYRAKYDFKLREGFDPSAAAYSDRVFKTPSATGPVGKAAFARAVEVMRREVLGEG